MTKWNESTQPIEQHPLRAGKYRAHQARWIVLAARDKDYDMAAYELDDGVLIERTGALLDRPYSELWSDLRSIELSRHKWWLVGFRVRHALAAAEWLQALSDGAIALPIATGKDGKRKRSGRMNMSPNVVEIDVVVGRNNVKLLDLDNYGVEPGGVGVALNQVGLSGVAGVLGGLLSAADKVGLSVSRPTAAQLGYARLRQQLTDHSVYVNADAEARALERRAYYGGRNEPYYLGDYPGKVYSLDVKSCYASICQQKDVPVMLREEYRAGCDVEILLAGMNSHWIAEVVIETESPDYPVKWCGSPIYPVGRFVTTLCWPELKHALLNGRVTRVLRAARYSARPLFAEFGMWASDSRLLLEKNGHSAYVGALKSAFNSALGYTARRSYTWLPWQTHCGRRYATGVTTSPEDHESVVSCQIIDGVAEWLRVGGEPREAMPMLHATVASWARVRLLDLFGPAGKTNVLYCDTDGILVNQAGMDRLSATPGLLGDAAGQLVERFHAGRCRVQGQKNYRIGDQWICAGMSKTKYSGLVEKQVLTTDCGRVRLDGYVEPFLLDSAPHDGERDGWVNRMA